MRFWSPRLVQELPRRLQKWSKRGQERAQIDPRVAQEPPRASYKPFKFGFRAILAPKWAPPGARELSGGLPALVLDLPRDDFPPSGEPFSRFFKAPGASALSCAQSLCKHTASQAYGQYSLTSLCNFYMWISTATDSRSIDR